MFLQAERTPEEKMETARLLWKFLWRLYDPAREEDLMKYVRGFDEEVESDGFITREEDLMKSERTAKPMTECGYPRCEECDKCVDGYCTVPMVIGKQIYLNTAERIVQLEETVSALENIVYDEILGDDDIPDKTLTMYKNITWDEVEI